jgi:uncharacterized protein
MAEKKLLDNIAMGLTAVGGLNWGLIGVFKFDLVEKIAGASVAPWVYGLVGVAAVWLIIKAFRK